MKHFAYYFGIAAALVASCSIQEEDIKTPQQDDVIFYASFEQPAEEGTRVYANEDLLLRWTADDRVSIFNKITYNQEYKFLGETGDNAGGFNRVDNAEFVTGNPISHVVSVYPYQAATKITEEEVVTLSLPAEQHYAENTFGLGANTMVSVSDDNVLQYKNVGGYLRLSLYGEGVSVSAITLRGNFREKLAGKATITMPMDGIPTVEMASEATTDVTLVCDTPVSLGATAEESKDFWLVIPPISFSRGFTVYVWQTSGFAYEITTAKSIAIERSKLSKMSPIKVEGDYPVPEAVDLGLPSGLKWASFNLGASLPERFGLYYAWGETEPKSIYDWSTYKWCRGASRSLTKYCSNSSYGYNGFTDTKTFLDPEDDAAYVNLGDPWRMPTSEDFAELQNSCTWEWSSMNRISGFKVVGTNGNSIFLPVAGYRSDSWLNFGGSGTFWSSELDEGHTYDAWSLHYYVGEASTLNSSLRYTGRSIRPVSE